MGFRIQNNIAAMNAQNSLGVSQTAMEKSLARLSSGYRINSAKDDAAGLAVSQQFRANIASYKVASRNVTEANAMLQVAEGGMSTIADVLTRLKELATQSASANTSNTDRIKINKEGNDLLAEIDRTANSTKYGTTSLINGTFGVGDTNAAANLADGLQSASGMLNGVTYTIASAANGGTAANADISISATINGQTTAQLLSNVVLPTAGTTKELSFDGLGLKLNLNSSVGVATLNANTIVGDASTSASFQVGTTNTANIDRIAVGTGNATVAGLSLAVDRLDDAAEAQTFMVTIDAAISTLSTARGNIGAGQNRLSYAAATLSTTIENTTAAESVIRDVDMAQEMTSFTKNQILVQAGTAMLAQANSAPQQILSLLKG
jgi:flagellin